MTRARTLMLLLLSLPGCATRAAATPNPFTADQVERLLRGTIEQEKILSDAQRECIAFRVTPDVAASFTRAGASEEFIRRLGGVCYRAPAPAARGRQ